MRQHERLERAVAIENDLVGIHRMQLRAARHRLAHRDQFRAGGALPEDGEAVFRPVGGDDAGEHERDARRLRARRVPLGPHPASAASSTTRITPFDELDPDEIQAFINGLLNEDK